MDLDESDCYYTCNGRIIDDPTKLPKDAIIRKYYRLRGGKGGFGSMLRAIGNQIEKTTNHEMCRDLTGRRMRDVNTERKLREWYDKAGDREKERVEKREERRKKRQEILTRGPLLDHKFSDEKYESQKRKISKGLTSALDEAINSISKPKNDTNKRARMGFLDDLDNLSSSSSDNEDSTSKQSGATIEQDMSKPSTSSTQPAIGYETRSGVGESDSAKRHEVDAGQSSKQSSGSSAPSLTTVSPLTDSQLESASTSSDLESHGLEVLKQSLVSRGLKCGGTLQERASRLFSIRGLSPEQYPGKLKAKK